MIKLKRFDEMLECLLTEEERAQKSEQLSKQVLDRRTLKAEAKRTAESFASKIKLADQEIENLAILLEDGKEFRRVECFEQECPDVPEVEVVRSDTGEVVRTRAMTAEERQTDLFPGDPDARNAGTTFFQGVDAFHFSETEATQIENAEAEAERERLHREAIAAWRKEPMTDQEAEDQPDLEGSSQGNEEDFGGTPYRRKLMPTEIDSLAKLVIQEGKPVKRGYVDGNPYVIVSQNGTPHQFVDRLEAYAVLPVSIAGEINDLKFNCGTKKKPDWWVAIGEKIEFTVDSPKQAASSNTDDFTAPICDECRRIDGGHVDTCSHGDVLRFDQYLLYAKAHYEKNHNSYARKMELTRTNDAEVRAWLTQAAVTTPDLMEASQ